MDIRARILNLDFPIYCAAVSPRQNDLITLADWKLSDVAAGRSIESLFFGNCGL